MTTLNSPSAKDDLTTAESNKKDIAPEVTQAKVVLRWKPSPNESIKFCSFADDERPHYVFLVLENDQTHVQFLKLVKVNSR